MIYQYLEVIFKPNIKFNYKFTDQLNLFKQIYEIISFEKLNNNTFC
jgi:hypothetical protein